MAKVNPYVQDRLASSLGIMPGMDTSGADLANSLSKDASVLQNDALNIYVAKKKQLKANEDKLKDINNTLSAYEKSMAVESELWSMIDKNKQSFINDPESGMEAIRLSGQATIRQAIDNESNPAVKEKMVGVLSNSFRGKMNEVNSWKLAQDTANATSKVQNTFNQMYTIAAGSSDWSRVQQLIDAVDSSENNWDRNGGEGSTEVSKDFVNYAYGKKGLEELDKAKRTMAGAYILGMIDRGECNQAKAILDSNKLDEYMDPETKHKFRNMADGVIKAKEKQERMDNMFQIFDIKQNAIIKASSGDYSIAQAVADNEKIKALGGTPTTSLTNAGVRGEKIQTKNEYKAKNRESLEMLNKQFETLLKKGKVDPEAELQDILAFQNKVESCKNYLTPQQYQSYMSKLSEPRIKKLKKMKKNIFGMPQGEIAGNDPTHRSYLAIYNFAHKAYAGKENQQNAITNMLLDFSKYAEQLEHKTGKEITQQQAANICNKVISDQRRKTNPHLNNIPKEGRVMVDKYGHKVRMYADGRHEIIK